jgi:PAS domain-containing protein
VTNTESRERLLILIWLAASPAAAAPPANDDGGAHPRSVPATRGSARRPAVPGGGRGRLVAGWVGAARLRGGQRLVGGLFAAGITAAFVGDFISIAIGWRTGGEPEASVADAAWLSSYIGLGAGLLVLLRQGDREGRRSTDGLIDVAAVFVAGMMVIWEFAVAPTVADESLSVGIRTLWGMYPVLDVALLALILRLVMRERTVVALLVAGGVAMWLAADFAYLMIASAVSYSELLDAGWLWGSILIALAVLRGPGSRWESGTEPEATSIDEVGLGRILVAMLPLLVPGLIELNGYLRGQDTHPAVVIPGTVVLVALAFLRMARLAWAARWARRALESQEHYASALAANSSDAVVVVDADLRLVDDFPKLAALVGYPDQNIRGFDLLMLVVPEDLTGSGPRRS